MKIKKRTARRAIPKREAEVCTRLRSVRELLRLSQVEFAEDVGINRQRLASYEECRAPLRYDIGLRICRHYIVSEKWLATGSGDVRLMMDLTSEGVTHQIPADYSFGKAFDEFLAPRYEALFKETEGQLRYTIREGDDMRFVENLFMMLVPRWCGMMEKHEWPKFLLQLIEVGVAMVGHRVKHGELCELVKEDHKDGVVFGGYSKDKPKPNAKK